MAKKTFNSKHDAGQLDALFDQARHRAMLGQWSATVDSDKSRMSIVLEITGPTVSGTYRPAEEAIPATEPAAPANLPADPPAIVEAAAVPAEASPAADVVVNMPPVEIVPLTPDAAVVEQALADAAANDGGTIDEILAPEAVTPKRKKKASNGE